MSDADGAMNVLTLSVEIALPDGGDELQDVVVDDLTDDANLFRLRNRITQWARLISGLPCHVEITVD